ncbi:hypothetical protein [Acinetobacter bouvetii]|uniref:HEPN domain-containing protein n=1 Tax=Acinetobacter bouvetii TaxID=202951 RepID=A0A811GD79_9GAMM|nr:hypothetical protein [Acinetobacter bouvetii]CAB1219908.1 hypothetical protein SFB21_2481 [Acinetobacter bouvetii]
MISEEWLNNLNDEFIKQGIPHRVRASEAYRRMCLEIVDTDFNSVEAKYVFEWFEKVTKPGSQNFIINNRFPFYYDGEFWLLNIPTIAGTPPLRDIEQYLDMPEAIKDQLIQAKKSYKDLKEYFFSCFDYVLTFDDVLCCLGKDTRTKKWLGSANGELRAGIEIVLSGHGISRAALNFRNSFENFLKALIFFKLRLNDKEMRDKFSHKLVSAFDQVIRITDYKKLNGLRKVIDKFPEVNDRYDVKNFDQITILEILCCTQIMAINIIHFIKTELK